MLVVSVAFVTDKDLILLGVVQGSIVTSIGIDKDLISSSGELTSHTEIFSEARRVAMNRMVSEAEKLKADAVINLRFASSRVTEDTYEIIAYGTAVKYKVRNTLQQF